MKPYIDRTNLKPIILKSGKPLKFDVDVRGEPPPTITWLHQKLEIKTDSAPTLTIDNKDHNTKLAIANTIRKNTGVYTIKAVNEHGKDEAEVEVTILSAPGKPTGPLKVQDVTKNGCKVKWKKPEDDGGVPVTAYQIEKLDKATGRWVPVGRTDGQAEEFDIKGLQEGHDYVFRVKAVNDEGESEPLESDHSICARNPYDLPGKPDVPLIDDWDDKSVTLKWKAPKSDGGAPITGYVVEGKEKFQSTWNELLTTDTPALTGKVPDLREGNTYQFRIRAVNKAGQGEPSEATQPHVAKHRYLKPWINRDKLKTIKVKAGNNVKLDVDIKGEPAPEVTWSIGERVIPTIDNNIKIHNEDYLTNFLIKDATRKNTGTYKIKAENSSGTDEATVEINIIDKPDAPQGPLEVADVHKNGCKLKWKKPKDDGGTPITSYSVDKLDPDTGLWTHCGSQFNPEKNEFDVKNLEPGKKYHFRVKANNEEGESEPLVTENLTLAKDPFDAPTEPGLPEIADYDEDWVKLKWDPPLRDGGAPITEYIVEVMDKDSGDWVKKVTVPNLGKGEAVVPKLEKGKNYKFRVKAVNKAGPSNPSEETNWHKARPKNRKLLATIIKDLFYIFFFIYLFCYYFPIFLHILLYLFFVECSKLETCSNIETPSYRKTKN